jgi:mRNA-degrading endonuclease RelE of RelBE toxin-antitoxin system
MVKGEAVGRPLKKNEFRIVFGSLQAQRGWNNLLAIQRAHLSDAWTQLTIDPLALSPTIHPLKGKLETVERNGVQHLQRQYELSGGARIWFYVDEEEKVVILVNVHTRHPNQTK